MTLLKRILSIGDVQKEFGFIAVLGLPFLALLASALLILSDLGAMGGTVPRNQAVGDSSQFSRLWLSESNERYLFGSHLVEDGTSEARLMLRVASRRSDFDKPLRTLVPPLLWFAFLFFIGGSATSFYAANMLIAPRPTDRAFVRTYQALRVAAWLGAWMSIIYILYAIMYSGLWDKLLEIWSLLT